VPFCGYAFAGYPLFRVLIIELRDFEGLGASLTLCFQTLDHHLLSTFTMQPATAGLDFPKASAKLPHSIKVALD
jgi:hypothetical protein